MTNSTRIQLCRRLLGGILASGCSSSASGQGELPAPRLGGPAADTTQPVQVFTLLGQSKRLGLGKVTGGGGNGTLVLKAHLARGGSANSHCLGKAEVYMESAKPCAWPWRNCSS
jgi:hypothetical protein